MVDTPYRNISGGVNSDERGVEPPDERIDLQLREQNMRT